MALVQFGAIVTNIVGKLGGHYFTRSLGGPTIVSNPRHRQNPNLHSATSYGGNAQNRSTISAALIFVVRQWKNVSATNKLAWQALAPFIPLTNKLGVTEKPSAYHLFVHINYGRIINQQSILLVPPAIIAQPVPIPFTLTPLHSSTCQINLSAAIPTGYVGYVSATPPISAGLKPPSGYYNFITNLAAGSSGTIELISFYNLRYGNPVVGQTVWVSLQLFNLATSYKGERSIAANVVT